MPATRERPALGPQLGRRAMLGATAMSCAFCQLLPRASAEEPTHGSSAAGPPHWAYEGEAGAARWGELSPAFKVCQLGLEQSPIDLAGAITAVPGRLDIMYRSMKLRVVNNGHTIQVNADPGSSCVIGGTTYALQQSHFHHPSEHLLSGKPFDLECHLVHRSAAGDIAVIGVFISPGETSAALQPIWNAMPRQEGPERDAGITFDPGALLPATPGYYRYSGSLTTPPCTQGIVWTVMQHPIDASPDQIRQFAALFKNNARPVQGHNRRFLLQSS